MGSYKKIRCHVCGASIEVWKPEEVPERCPVCDSWWGKEEIDKQGGGTGLTTANTYFHLDDERTNTN